MGLTNGFIIKGSPQRPIYGVLLVALLTLYHCSQLARTNPIQDYPKELAKLDRIKLVNDIDFITDVANFNESSLDSLDANELIRKFMIGAWRMPVNDISGMHQYDNYQEKLISGGPKINNALCSRQLDYLVDQLTSTKPLSYPLYNLLDSYGRPEAGLARGSWYWLGDYNQCKLSQFKYHHTQDANEDEEKFYGTRYCLASIRWRNWINTTNFDNERYTSIKNAICIPESCDSIGAESAENRDKIKTIMELNFGHASKDFYISSIYCLPDAESPLTDWKQDKYALSFIFFITIWLVLIAISTLFDLIVGFNNYQQRQMNHHNTTTTTMDGQLKLAGSNCCNRPNDQAPLQAINLNHVLELDVEYVNRQMVNSRSQQQQQQQQQAGSSLISQLMESARPLRQSIKRTTRKLIMVLMKMLSMFSLVRNARILFTIKSRVEFVHKSSANQDEHTESPEAIAHVNPAPDKHLVERSVDLGFLNGFKSINMLIIVLTHLFLLITLVVHFADTGEMFGRHYFYYLTVAGLCVNNFIHITGMLTTYILFKRYSGKIANFWLQPSIWLGFSIHRYLRLIPLWAILVWYMKSLSKYTGSGPLWEYATSNTSRVRYCEQETWSHIFLATANYVRPYESCICSGWYLATDLQYAIVVTPIFMILMMRSRLWSFIFANLAFLGWLLRGLVAVSSTDYNKPYLNKQTNLVTSVFVRELGFVYTEPYYRVGFYFLGLLTGHVLYLHEKNDPWARSFVHRLRGSFLAHGATMAVLATITSILPSLKMPLDAFIFNTVSLRMFSIVASVILQTYLMSIFTIVISTSKDKLVTFRRILAYKPWKITSRMCLTILLVNPIVIQHFYQMLTQTFQLTYTIQSALIITMVFWTYSVSVMVYLLFESPLLSLVDLLHKMM